MTSRQPRILGIAASLRNARWGRGGQDLIDDLAHCPDKSSLMAYLTRQSELHLENFIQAGRAEGLDFKMIADNLRKQSGTVGLSNSEVALAASLWAAAQLGAAVDHISLSEYFAPRGRIRREAELKQKLLESDGFILSGPVYFGDRGSLAESLISLIACDDELRQALKGRLYGGIAVGAKRNGGQETTLIYQMLDMLDLGWLAVGNDSETTAQYGGTGHAGDVGTMHKDMYGIDTSMGLGRRMAQVLAPLCSGARTSDPPRTLFIVLQDDKTGLGRRESEALAERMGDRMQARILDVSGADISRCIACDICPTHVGLDSEYRCTITANTDPLPQLHKALLDHDLIVPVIVTSKHRAQLVSAYQSFIERTRYLRRSDYIWSDLVIAPMILQESASLDSYPIRAMTSFIRHHTVMSRPILGVHSAQGVLNRPDLDAGLGDALTAAARLTAGRLALHQQSTRRYNPVGYVLSSQKDAEDEKLRNRDAMQAKRKADMLEKAAARLA